MSGEQSMRVMYAEVVEVLDLSPALRRIVFGGPELAGYPTTGVGDEYIRMARPVGEGYVWVAGETKTLRGVRKHLRRELGLPATAYKTLGYWTEGAEIWRERYAALDEDTKAELAAMWDSDRDPEAITDEYEARLTSLGL